MARVREPLNAARAGADRHRPTELADEVGTDSPTALWPVDAGLGFALTVVQRGGVQHREGAGRREEPFVHCLDKPNLRGRNA